MNDRQIHFLANMSSKIGKESSILLENIIFWVGVAEKKKDLAHFKNGKYWMYITIDTQSKKGSLCKQYPFMTKYKIRESLKNLENMGYIECCQDFNKLGFDRTTWYTVTESAINMKNDCIIDEKIDTIYFSSKVAEMYNINTAIVLDLIGKFAEHSKHNDLDNNFYFHKGRYWTKCSVSYIASHTRLSDQNVRTAIKALLKDEIISKDNFSSKESTDRSSWYTLTAKGEELLGVCVSCSNIQKEDFSTINDSKEICYPKEKQLLKKNDAFVNFESCICQDSNLHLLNSVNASINIETPIPDTYYDTYKNLIKQIDNQYINRLIETIKLENGEILMNDLIILKHFVETDFFMQYCSDLVENDEITLAINLGLFDFYYETFMYSGILEKYFGPKDEYELQSAMKRLSFVGDVFNMLRDTIATKESVISFCGKNISTKRLSSKILNLNKERIESIILGIENNSKQRITNPKKYIESCIWNSFLSESSRKLNQQDYHLTNSFTSILKKNNISEEEFLEYLKQFTN